MPGLLDSIRHSAAAAASTSTGVHGMTPAPGSPYPTGAQFVHQQQQQQLQQQPQQLQQQQSTAAHQPDTRMFTDRLLTSTNATQAGQAIQSFVSGCISSNADLVLSESIPIICEHLFGNSKQRGWIQRTKSESDIRVLDDILNPNSQLMKRLIDYAVAYNKMTSYYTKSSVGSKLNLQLRFQLSQSNLYSLNVIRSSAPELFNQFPELFTQSLSVQHDSSNEAALNLNSLEYFIASFISVPLYGHKDESPISVPQSSAARSIPVMIPASLTPSQHYSSILNKWLMYFAPAVNVSAPRNIATDLIESRDAAIRIVQSFATLVSSLWIALPSFSAAILQLDPSVPGSSDVINHQQLIKPVKVTKISAAASNLLLAPTNHILSLVQHFISADRIGACCVSLESPVEIESLLRTFQPDSVNPTIGSVLMFTVTLKSTAYNCLAHSMYRYLRIALSEVIPKPSASSSHSTRLVDSGLWLSIVHTWISWISPEPIVGITCPLVVNQPHLQQMHRISIVEKLDELMQSQWRLHASIGGTLSTFVPILPWAKYTMANFAFYSVLLRILLSSLTAQGGVHLAEDITPVSRPTGPYNTLDGLVSESVLAALSGVAYVFSSQPVNTFSCDAMHAFDPNNYASARSEMERPTQKQSSTTSIDSKRHQLPPSTPFSFRSAATTTAAAATPGHHADVFSPRSSLKSARPSQIHNLLRHRGTPARNVHFGEDSESLYQHQQHQQYQHRVVSTPVTKLSQMMAAFDNEEETRLRQQQNQFSLNHQKLHNQAPADVDDLSAEELAWFSSIYVIIDRQTLASNLRHILLRYDSLVEGNQPTDAMAFAWPSSSSHVDHRVALLKSKGWWESLAHGGLSMVEKEAFVAPILREFALTAQALRELLAKVNSFKVDVETSRKENAAAAAAKRQEQAGGLAKWLWETLFGASHVPSADHGLNMERDLIAVFDAFAKTINDNISVLDLWHSNVRVAFGATNARFNSISSDLETAAGTEKVRLLIAPIIRECEILIARETQGKSPADLIWQPDMSKRDPTHIANESISQVKDGFRKFDQLDTTTPIPILGDRGRYIRRDDEVPWLGPLLQKLDDSLFGTDAWVEAVDDDDDYNHHHHHHRQQQAVTRIKILYPGQHLFRFRILARYVNFAILVLLLFIIYTFFM
ncbi:hypothetical protein GQ42DRAFT_163847 [Ramicandelaber brevisporus]|nr:hypothetical protein GQ42DRAFT_163847 [Ramicandelaber brevisporus]